MRLTSRTVAQDHQHKTRCLIIPCSCTSPTTRSSKNSRATNSTLILHCSLPKASRSVRLPALPLVLSFLGLCVSFRFRSRPAPTPSSPARTIPAGPGGAIYVACAKTPGDDPRFWVYRLDKKGIIRQRVSTGGPLCLERWLRNLFAYAGSCHSCGGSLARPSRPRVSSHLNLYVHAPLSHSLATHRPCPRSQTRTAAPAASLGPSSSVRTPPSS